jgi:hypothetical protein
VKRRLELKQARDDVLSRARELEDLF